jgi:hypothetical protein
MQDDWSSILICILVSLLPLFFLRRRYLRRYRSTPFLTPIHDGDRIVPFGVAQVRRLAEKSMQMDR